jgi:hypothetical protein
MVAMLVPLALYLPSAEAAVPSEKDWLSDVNSAMAGSQRYVDSVQGDSGRLAVNFDIDNTTLATHYDPGQPVERVLHFAQYAHQHGIALVFNTARLAGGGRMTAARHQLEVAGYDVAAICGRNKGESLVHSKTRCRKHYVDSGYTLVANVGNRDTDFQGGYYARAFRLPNYGNQLT